MFSIEKTFKGPYGTEIKFGLPIFAVIIAIFLFFKWQRSAMGFTYEILELIISNKFSLVCLGATLLCLGILLPKAFPEHSKGRKSILMSALVIGGILLPAIAFLSPLMQSVPRWAGPSIGLVQFDDSSGLSMPIHEAVNNINRNLDESIALNSLSIRPDNLSQVLKNVSRYQYDIVILDYPNPTMVRGKDLSGYLNSRSLYILTQPVNPDSSLPKNVLYLSPPIVEEIYALASQIPPSNKPITIVHSQTARSISATDLLSHALHTRGHSLSPPKNWNDVDFTRFQPENSVIWLGWEHKTLPRGTVLKSPSFISIDKNSVFSIKPLNPLPYVSNKKSGAGGWIDNQVLALNAVLNAHFIDKNRPLNTDVTVEAVVHRLANEHLATVSKAMRLVPRYEN
jgi:hypothetical protein